MLERKNEPRFEIAKWPIFGRVWDIHRNHLKNPKLKIPAQMESGWEIELRFWPDFDATPIRKIDDVDAFMERLLSLPGTYERQIRQGNAQLYTGKGEEHESFRMRITERMPGRTAESKRLAEEEGVRYRVAIKSEPDEYGAKLETQEWGRADDQAQAERNKMFLYCFEHKTIRRNIRRRVYIPVTFKNGDTGEFHVDVYATPEKLADVPRIELECHTRGGYQYVVEHMGKIYKKFPWVGKDVTGDKRARSKNLVDKGLPPEIAEIMKKIRAASQGPTS